MEIQTICVAGLGYVGLPLAIELSRHFTVIGFDVSEKRITELNNNLDNSGETAQEVLENTTINYTSNLEMIRTCNFIIVCVPTPVDDHNKPDLTFVESASELVGKNLSSGSIVVYESTVYPGVTEDVCVPILEKFSGLKHKQEFKVGYSPERINPGDKEHSIGKITKIVSGSDEESLSIIDYVYSKVTTTHKSPTIRVAEAAKVIENIQRDLNIALMNELAIIFDKMNIDVYDVLKAAGTKWNFHHYVPGLVGGHCIGVDPYYLTYKAEEHGYHPEVILAGRRINDNMHKYYAEKIIKHLQKNGGKSVLLLGLTFKPNVSDYRNSRVKYLIKELKDYNIKVQAYDPYLTPEVINKQFHVDYIDINKEEGAGDVVIIATQHQQLLDLVKEGRFKQDVLFMTRMR